MKIVGIIGRAYYNIDNKKIIQCSEFIRKALALYDDVVSILLLPQENIFYVDTPIGKDKINEKKLNYILDKCDAFIAPGGNSFYKFDEFIIKYAIKHNKPLLGICAGFQSLCSIFAKKRTKFDMTEEVKEKNHNADPYIYIHNVKIKKGTKLYNILKKENIFVNSCHNNCVNFEMNTLKISSYSDDNIIESCEVPLKKFIIALQWHPEYLMDKNSIKIFDAFINSFK